MLWEPRLNNRVREGNSGRFQRKDEKGKRRASVLSSFSLSWFSVIHVFMSSAHALSYLLRLFTSLRGANFWSCVSSAKSWWYTEWLAIPSERDVVYRTEENGPQYWALRHTVHEVWLMTKTSYWLKWREIIWWSIVSKAAERSNKRRTEMLSLSRAERILVTIHNN